MVPRWTRADRHHTRAISIFPPLPLKSLKSRAVTTASPVPPPFAPTPNCSRPRPFGSKSPARITFSSAITATSYSTVLPLSAAMRSRLRCWVRSAARSTIRKATSPPSKSTKRPMPHPTVRTHTAAIPKTPGQSPATPLQYARRRASRQMRLYPFQHRPLRRVPPHGRLNIHIADTPRRRQSRQRSVLLPLRFILQNNIERRPLQ